MEEPTTEGQRHSCGYALTTHCPPYFLVKDLLKESISQVTQWLPGPCLQKFEKRTFHGLKGLHWLPSKWDAHMTKFFLHMHQRACLCVLGIP